MTNSLPFAHPENAFDIAVSDDEIIRDFYPELTADDIHACMRYAIALVAAEEIHLATAVA